VFEWVGKLLEDHLIPLELAIDCIRARFATFAAARTPTCCTTGLNQRFSPFHPFSH
jgi:hypothetical protein